MLTNNKFIEVCNALCSSVEDTRDGVSGAFIPNVTPEMLMVVVATIHEREAKLTWISKMNSDKAQGLVDELMNLYKKIRV
jgi:hypothetical protein